MEKKILMGVNVPGGTNLNGLNGALETIVRDGWDAAELNLASCPLIIGGELCRPVAEYVKEVFSRYPLRYTAHTAYGLDLRNREDADLHRRALLSSVEACAVLGIDRLNVHYEEYSHDHAAEAQFKDRIREAADLAQEKGVMLNVENIEVEDYRYALDAIREIDHPNVGMTLDLGHMWISSRYYHYDALEGVRACAPYVRHLHINDNMGVFEPMRLENQQLYNTLDKGYRFTFSRGDIHIPPLYGNAPLREALAILKAADYGGIWLCEYYSHLFAPLNDDIRRAVRQVIEES